MIYNDIVLYMLESCWFVEKDREQQQDRKFFLTIEEQKKNDNGHVELHV